ncbi:DNA polymerase epsilon subunit 3 Chrac-14 [Lycorma delicatula]|uniref:DNA polymerase epsilon subunit 3 Chrac-14 n=1 Tax=Lycorma delicatula TaxID=130591 RepID=UPI003F518E2C
MAEKLEDLNLPIAVVTRLIREVIPENCNVSKEARTAVAKAASVFVLFLTSTANQNAMLNNRKTINANDVLEGIKRSSFEHFVAPLQDALEGYKKVQKEKKDASAKKKKEKGKQDGSVETDEQEIENNVEEEEENED